MEAACESARHAVNGILAHVEEGRTVPPGGPAPSSPLPRQERWERCAIVPLDEREPGDLAFFKRLDEKLLARGAPHFVEILGAEELLTALVGSDLELGDPEAGFTDLLSNQLSALNVLGGLI
jgi:hypothetical protein